MDDLNLYNKEYKGYMELALQRFLIEKKGMSEYDAKEKVIQDYEAVEAEAKLAKYI